MLVYTFLRNLSMQIYTFLRNSKAQFYTFLRNLKAESYTFPRNSDVLTMGRPMQSAKKIRTALRVASGAA